MSILRNHPDALLLITGYFNPSSTGFDERMVKRIAGLTQIINVKTRGNAILDWCLTNAKKSFFVDTGQVYQALRKIKTNKSPGPT